MYVHNVCRHNKVCKICLLNNYWWCTSRQDASATHAHSCTNQDSRWPLYYVKLHVSIGNNHPFDILAFTGFGPSDCLILPGTFKKEAVFNGIFSWTKLPDNPNNITHSATLGLKGHCTSLHFTIARMVGDLLKAGNCFRENKQTLGFIWGKKNSSSNLERFEKLTSPLHSFAPGSLFSYSLFWPLCPFLSLYLFHSSIFSTFWIPLPFFVVRVISPIHLTPFPPLWLITHTRY